VLGRPGVRIVLVLLGRLAVGWSCH
jgi:hypothetical protein